jgi:transposase
MQLPPRIEEYITEDNPVQVIDVHLDRLDLKALGFNNINGGQTPGQHSYPPFVLLKLYLYDYLPLSGVL